MTFIELATNLPQAETTSNMVYDARTHESYYTRNYIASKVFTTGSKLTNPICWCSSYVHRIVSPFLPGQYDFKSTIIEEIAIRGLYIIELCMLTPASVPLAGAGIGCRCIGAYLIPEGFCYLKGDLKEETHLKNSSLSVLTWNVCGIGGSMERSHGGVREWKKRVGEITKQVKEEKPDILCFQEVHDTDFANSLFEKLKADYAHFYLHTGPNPFGSNSGNFMASKYPIKDFSFHEFNSSTGSGKWQKKGFVNFTVYSDKKALVHVAATHFQYGEKIDGKSTILEVRKSQLSQIMNSCTKSLKENLPILLVGDLNIEKDSDEYNDSYLSTYFTHGFSYNEPTSTCHLIRCIWDSSMSTNDHIDEKIDYFSFLKKDPKTGKVLTHPKFEVRLLKAYEKEDPSAARSDHHGLLGNIYF